MTIAPDLATAALLMAIPARHDWPRRPTDARVFAYVHATDRRLALAAGLAFCAFLASLPLRGV